MHAVTVQCLQEKYSLRELVTYTILNTRELKKYVGMWPITAVKKRQLRKMASVRDGMVTAHVPWSVTCSCMHANASHKITKIVFAFGENIFDSLWRLARFA